jgi:hypothetical protein
VAPFLLVYIAFNPGFPVHQTVPADDIPIDALNLYVRNLSWESQLTSARGSWAPTVTRLVLLPLTFATLAQLKLFKLMLSTSMTLTHPMRLCSLLVR